MGEACDEQMKDTETRSGEIKMKNCTTNWHEFRLRTPITGKVKTNVTGTCCDLPIN